MTDPRSPAAQPRETKVTRPATPLCDAIDASPDFDAMENHGVRGQKFRELAIKLELDRRRLVEALRVACLQIAHLQEISGTDRHGELDALRDGKALLRDLGELE